MTTGWLFWMVVAFLVWRAMASHRYRGRSARMRYWRQSGSSGPVSGGMPRELEQQRSYIDALETRVTELEERLDFTERLLAGRANPSG